MDYTKHRIRAVVDWIEIVIQTTDTTNFQTVQRAFGAALRLPADRKIWIENQNGHPSGADSIFSVRLHDVARHSDITDALHAVNEQLPLEYGFTVSKIEIALDDYCDDAPAQVARFYKYLKNPVSDNRRLYGEGKGTGEAIPANHSALARKIALGKQVAIGNTTDDRYQHLYFKTTDDGGKTVLPQAEHRARIEIRLSGSGIPHESANDWANFRFESLARYFSFTTEKDNLSPLQQIVTNAPQQVGESKVRVRASGGRIKGIRLHGRTIRADDELNALARNALRKLSARWKPTKPTIESNKQKAELPGFSVGLKRCNPHESSKVHSNSNNYVSTLFNSTENSYKQHPSQCIHNDNDGGANDVELMDDS